MIAYNLGNLWRRLVLFGAAEGNRYMIVDQLITTAGEACAVLLADSGGKPSDATSVWMHATADGGITAASRVGAAGR